MMDIREAATKLRPEYQKKTGDLTYDLLRSVGMEMGIDNPSIICYVSSLNNKAAKFVRELPDQKWCGFPVRLQQMGKIIPL
jgi:hypothetical protein